MKTITQIIKTIELTDKEIKEAIIQWIIAKNVDVSKNTDVSFYDSDEIYDLKAIIEIKIFPP